jgi:hypothetical protein
MPRQSSPIHQSDSAPTSCQRRKDRIPVIRFRNHEKCACLAPIQHCIFDRSREILCQLHLHDLASAAARSSVRRTEKVAMFEFIVGAVFSSSDPRVQYGIRAQFGPQCAIYQPSARGGGRRLSGGVGGRNPRARPAPMGLDLEQSRRCAPSARPRDSGTSRGRGRRLSRGNGEVRSREVGGIHRRSGLTLA